MVRRFALAAIVAGAAVAAMAVPVLADGGPHVAEVNSGLTTLTADSCAGCHRAHTAAGAMLIAASDETQLCLTCHGPSGAGATTNVIDGVKVATTQGLKGGGFVNTLMDTAWNGTPTMRPATSAHAYDGMTDGTMWGNGAIGSGPGAGPVQLTCATCHNPHGNNAYRILRPIPNDSNAMTGVDVEDEAVTRYTVNSPLNRYFGEQYGDGFYNWQWQYQLVEWCAQCHTRYDAYYQYGVTGPPGSTDSGDPIFKYRHMTRYDSTIDCALCHPGSNGINADDPFNVGYATAHEAVCENCHVAHGSSAVMGTYSGLVAWPDGATAPAGNARSSLLRLDNRGVCIGCHNPTN